MKHKEPAGRSGYYPHGHYAGSPNRRQKKPLRKPLFYALIAACACVFVISAVLLIRYYTDIASSRNASAQLSDIYQAAQESSPATSVGRTFGRAFRRAFGFPHAHPHAGFLRRAAVHGIVRPPLRQRGQPDRRRSLAHHLSR